MIRIYYQDLESDMISRRGKQLIYRRRSSSNQSGDVQIKNQDVNRRLEELEDN